ncbi:ricin-type beta-trefoil lectin domain protein [Yinghuangia sp. KLBMP8922]|uniref:Ricin-type beta-trefoil lectin domain protein n=2 Tax=Yinghuangia soli TaxID=2908204 RepID=A0AA41U227_9ACTN|nr:ricin-type beta-trefoil lectin domain protein [Yinghuangia soli]MCF2528167.1 ricin-type beta-trefoil lectin domain protein [Yinghuangia soli]
MASPVRAKSGTAQLRRPGPAGPARFGRRAVGTLTAMVLAVGGLGLLSGPQANAAAPAPLRADLEAIRAAEAQQLYGSPVIRPVDQRKSSIISLGDSEISGEGVGTYEAPTDGPTNWCHRSPQAAIHRTGIPVDLTYNVACSGASSVNIQIGGSKQYADELVQSDSLAIKARNTRLKMILLVAGANDDLQFGPTITDCVTRRVFFQGECYGIYQPVWKARLEALRPKVEQTIRDLRTVMTDAGYANGDYKLVVMGYPTPMSPDVEDNPNFPGWYGGGCLGYLRDMAWGRNEAVPTFAEAQRQAAANTGAMYLDNSRLFDGHEVCTDNTWVRGLWFANLDLFDENTTRQSFHPNERGHIAFASCLTQFYNSGYQNAGCVDPASTGSAVLTEGVKDFRQLRNEATGLCADSYGYSSRNYTPLQLWPCQGGRNQGFWLDPTYQSVHIELSHDRCLDPQGGSRSTGTPIVLWNCNGGDNQRFVLTGGTLRPANAQTLCVTPAGTDPTLGAKLVLAACNGSAAQRYAAEPHQAAVFTELKAGNTGKCLDINAGSMANGTAVLAWDCTGNTNQKWFVNPASGQVHSLKDPNFCLDNRGTTAAGSGVGIWSCKDGVGAYRDNLRFDSVAGALVSRVSGLRVTAPGGGNGAVTQQAANGTSGQTWAPGAAVPLGFSPIPYDAY